MWPFRKKSNVRYIDRSDGGVYYTVEQGSVKRPVIEPDAEYIQPEVAYDHPPEALFPWILPNTQPKESNRMSEISELLEGLKSLVEGAAKSPEVTTVAGTTIEDVEGFVDKVVADVSTNLVPHLQSVINAAVQKHLGVTVDAPTGGPVPVTSGNVGNVTPMFTPNPDSATSDIADAETVTESAEVKRDPMTGAVVEA